MRRELHWLPYPERVEFKLCSTIYKCLHNSAPQYLIELCIPVATLPGRCHLRSAAYGDLFVPATSTKTIGPRGFSYAGPVAWNSLQPVLKDPTLSFIMFKKLLKTELFNLKVILWGVSTPQRPKNSDNSKTTVDKNLKFFDFYYMTVV